MASDTYEISDPYVETMADIYEVQNKPVYNKIKATRNEIDALLNREDIEIKIGILRAKKIPKTLGLF